MSLEQKSKKQKAALRAACKKSKLNFKKN